MTIEQIAKILTDHHVPYRIDGDRISADTMRVGFGILEEVEDVTGYRYHQLLDWLGY